MNVSLKFFLQILNFKFVMSPSTLKNSYMFFNLVITTYHSVLINRGFKSNINADNLTPQYDSIDF